ncbi:hypothetical protein HYW17_05590 [Candidatus Uhrbacteria bacterium]|nr:hypothetical protein [Candidatus Uhrbacteria bacterium]
MRYYLVLDVGTTGIKALVFSQSIEIVGRAYARIRKTHPKPGFVEQSPSELLAVSKQVLRTAVRASRVPLKSLRAFGLTNQRETAIVWNRKTGKPIYPAIVWEDKRTAKECAVAKRRRPSLSDEVRGKTGLAIDPYFSATKVGWILRNVVSNRSHPSLILPSGRGGKRIVSPPRRGGVRGGELFFGTVDTWILWNLLEGRPHLTDWTNASRTLLYNIRTLKWDDELLEIFGVPRAILPEVRPSQSKFGVLRHEVVGARLPVRAVCGDQQASMYGVGVSPGTTKVTYGTGTFLVQSLGSKYVLRQPFFTTLMPGARRPQFALEAKIEGSGSAIDKVLHDVNKLDRALTYIAKDVDGYLKKLPIRPRTLVIDGGITRDVRMVSIQAKVSGVNVRRQITDDGTALGVAKLLRDYETRNS